jgi:DNA-directed RNA polymerase specialized sigma24 family protein
MGQTKDVLAEDFVQSEMIKEIDKCMNVMKPVEREIAYLRFYEHLKYKDISRIVGLNMNTTKARIRQIKIKIKNHLRRYL